MPRLDCPSVSAETLNSEPYRPESAGMSGLGLVSLLTPKQYEPYSPKPYLNPEFKDFYKEAILRSPKKGGFLGVPLKCWDSGEVSEQ